MEKALGEKKAKYIYILARCSLPRRKGEQVEACQISTSPIDGGKRNGRRRNGSRYTESPASGSDTISPSFQKTLLSTLHFSFCEH